MDIRINDKQSIKFGVTIRIIALYPYMIIFLNNLKKFLDTKQMVCVTGLIKAGHLITQMNFKTNIASVGLER